jgi:hypothetical protein
MPERSQCRKVAFNTEAQRLERMRTRHAESCQGDRDCPLNALECVMAAEDVDPSLVQMEIQ